MYLKLLLITLLNLVLSGCGYIYTNTVTPLCTDMRNTPASDKLGVGMQKNVNIPRVPGTTISWSSNAIIEAAHRAGLSKVHYCDLKRFSVLGGLWRSETIVVYGE